MLTFDTIRDIERMERDSKKLIRLPETFITDVREYLRKKEQPKSAADIQEMESVRSIIRRLFESREKKLADFAVYTVRTGFQPENLTKEEERLFHMLVDEISRFRENFFSELNRKEKKTAFRVKKSLPAFVGPDMKTYELKENEVLSPDFLPKPLNDLLLKEGVIELTEE